MKKNIKILAVLLAATMIASCGKESADITSSESVDDAGEETYSELEEGSVFTFGSYNGQDISWIVLSREGDSCELLAFDNIESLPVDSYRCRSWEDSDLRDWLRDDFFNEAFSDEEKKRIDDPDSFILNDPVYLLSSTDLNKYSEVIGQYEASEDWWLRSGITTVNDPGDIATATGEAVTNVADVTEEHGVRPAMHFYAGDDQEHLESNGDRFILWPEDDLADIGLGGRFRFGTYNGEPIDWIVLSKEGCYCEVIAVDVIDELPMDEDGNCTSWEDSSLNSWLNNEFYEDSFSDDEKMRLDVATDEGANISLLSEEELVSYSSFLAAHPASGEFWLMSDPDGTAAAASETGELLPDGKAVDETCGVRPVMMFYCGNNPYMFGEPTPTVTPIPTPTPTPTPVADPIDADEDQYAIVMDEIETIEAEHPGSCYQLEQERDRENDTCYWVLTSYYEETSHEHVIRNGEMSEIGTSSDEPTVMLSYEEITSIPFLVDTSESWRFGRNEIVDTIADGRYFGGVIGFSQDGTRMWLSIGTPIVLERSFVETLEVGDSIGYSVYGEELIVTDISTYGDTPFYSLSNGYFLSGDYCEDPENEYMVTGDNDCPCAFDPVIVEVPVSSSCTVTDTYDRLGTVEGYDEIEPTGNPILDSYWWYFQSNVPYGNVYASNGWYCSDGLAYPVVISGGEVVSINIEWR